MFERVSLRFFFLQHCRSLFFLKIPILFFDYLFLFFLRFDFLLDCYFLSSLSQPFGHLQNILQLLTNSLLLIAFLSFLNPLHYITLTTETINNLFRDLEEQRVFRPVIMLVGALIIFGIASDLATS